MKSVYFIGIGGSGMLPLALFAKNYNFSVSGSDKNTNEKLINILENNKIKLFKSGDVGENLDYLKKFNFIVYSSAISNNHPELKYAIKLTKKDNVKLLHRMDFLNLCMQDNKNNFAIAGTHGKSSSTAMLSWLLVNWNLDPSLIMGARPLFLSQGFRVGNNKIGVYESDESDSSFLSINANLRLILNIDKDHLDNYKTWGNLVKAFENFINNGEIISLNLNDPTLLKIFVKLKNKVLYDKTNLNKKILIGFKTFNTKNDFENEKLLINKTFLNNNFCYLYYSYFENNSNNLNIYLLCKNKLTNKYSFKKKGVLNLKNLIGKHFASNALGVLSLLDTSFNLKILTNENYSLENSINYLNNFTGIERRLELISKKNMVYIYDDYGHHPTEIIAVLDALKSKIHQEKTNAKLTVFFQPHRYTRTKELYKQFAEALFIADEIYILEIYSAGENKINGVDSKLIFDNFPKVINNNNNNNNKKKIIELIEYKITKKPKINEEINKLNYEINRVKEIIKLKNKNDIVLALGAGNISEIIRKSIS